MIFHVDVKNKNNKIIFSSSLCKITLLKNDFIFATATLYES